MSEARATATVVLRPRDAGVLALGPDARAAWVTASFEVPCTAAAAELDAAGVLRADVALSTRGVVDEGERALLLARPADQALWKAWIEKSFVAGWCDVAGDVDVSVG